MLGLSYGLAKWTQSTEVTVLGGPTSFEGCGRRRGAALPRHYGGATCRNHRRNAHGDVASAASLRVRTPQDVFMR